MRRLKRRGVPPGGFAAVRDAVRIAKPRLLEPDNEVEVDAPCEEQGDLLGELARRRANIVAVEARHEPRDVKGTRAARGTLGLCECHSQPEPGLGELQHDAIALRATAGCHGAKARQRRRS